MNSDRSRGRRCVLGTFVMLATLFATRAVYAQAGVVWAIDGSVGFSQAEGDAFVNRGDLVERFALSARRSLRHGIGLNAELGYEWTGVVIGGDAICILVSPQGGCKPDFPPIGGPSGLVGLSVDAGAIAELRIGTGMAAYNVGNTRLGAPIAAIDLATTPHSWFGVLIRTHAFMLPNYRNDRVWGTTWQLGLRLRSHQ